MYFKSNIRTITYKAAFSLIYILIVDILIMYDVLVIYDVLVMH